MLGLVAAVVPVFPEKEARPTRDQMKAGTLARWSEWRCLLDEGVYRNKAELARAAGVSRSAVTKGLLELALKTGEQRRP